MGKRNTLETVGNSGSLKDTTLESKFLGKALNGRAGENVVLKSIDQ